MLAGLLIGMIDNSIVSGSITGDNYVCGLVGINYGTIDNSNSSGSVIGKIIVGGFVGENFGGTYTNNTWCNLENSSLTETSSGNIAGIATITDPEDAKCQ